MKQAATTSGSSTMGASQWGQQPAAGLGSSRLAKPAMLNRHGSQARHTRRRSLATCWKC